MLLMIIARATLVAMMQAGGFPLVSYVTLYS